MGASRLLVRFTVRMRPFDRSSLDEDIAIWFVGGVKGRAFLMRAPSEGEEARFDIFGEELKLQAADKQSQSHHDAARAPRNYNPARAAVQESEPRSPDHRAGALES